MALIPNGTRFIGISEKADLKERKSELQNQLTEPYTIEDIKDSQGIEIPYEIQGGTLGVQPTFDGDPLFSGSYIKIGNLVHFQIQVDMDNITNFGSGQYFVSIPFPSKYGYMFRCGCLHDESTGREYHISGHASQGDDKILLYTSDTQGNNLYDFPFTSTEPVTLNALDNFHIAGSYIIQ
jgi:hypothetical protein